MQRNPKRCLVISHCCRFPAFSEVAGADISREAGRAGSAKSHYRAVRYLKLFLFIISPLSLLKFCSVKSNWIIAEVRTCDLCVVTKVCDYSEILYFYNFYNFYNFEIRKFNAMLKCLICWLLYILIVSLEVNWTKELHQKDIN